MPDICHAEGYFDLFPQRKKRRKCLRRLYLRLVAGEGFVPSTFGL